MRSSPLTRPSGLHLLRRWPAGVFRLSAIEELFQKLLKESGGSSPMAISIRRQWRARELSKNRGRTQQGHVSLSPSQSHDEKKRCCGSCGGFEKRNLRQSWVRGMKKPTTGRALKLVS